MNNLGSVLYASRISHRTTAFFRLAPPRRSSHKFPGFLILPILLIVSVGFFPSYFVAAATKSSCPPTPNPLTRTSQIWSGYAACKVDSTGTYVTISSVSGSWKIPKILSCDTTEDSLVFVWVGIDGASDLDSQSTTVEQVGTASKCLNGTITYYAWYEYFVSNSGCFVKPIKDWTPNSGDSMDARLTANAGGTFTLSIMDTTINKPFSISSNSPTDCNISSTPRATTAEWILEVPSNHSVPDAEGVTFSGCSFTPQGGAAGSISSASGTAIFTLPLIPSAVPSDPSAAGDSFTISWVSQPGGNGGGGGFGCGTGESPRYCEA